MRQKKAVIFISLLVLTLVFSFQPGFALALTYDPYDNQPKYPEAYDKEKVKKSDSLYNILSFYTLPFKFADKGIEKILDWAERTHFPQKVKWLWEDVLHENGIFPEARFSAKGLSIGGGGTLKLEKLLGFESQHPYLKIHGGGGANSSGDTDVNSMIELSQQEGFKLYSRNLFKLSHLNNETFWGLGPRSSIADGVEYEMTTLTLKNQTGFKPFQGVDLGGEVFYRHVTVQDTNDRNVADINDRFNIGTLPGIDGGLIFSTGAYISHDTRDYPKDPSRGGFRGFSFNFNRDTRHNDNYFKYRFQISQYFPLGSDRRVLALHFGAEHVQDVNHSSIPFFDLAQVGGFGIQPSVSWAHRGFRTHRFYDTSSAVLNLEYRYNVWQYGDYGADWVFFSDLGKVFDELQAFGKGRVKVSYGTGVRIKAYRRVIFTFQLAHSNEGLRAYVRTKTAF